LHFFSISTIQTFLIKTIQDLFTDFIRRAIHNCDEEKILSILSSKKGELKSFLCKKNTSQAMVQMMDQAWESLLKCSLKPNPGNAQDVDSIVSAIDSTYSKTTSGFSTTAQSEFKKLFVEIVCTAFTVCTTVPTKNPPRFGAHKKVRTKKN
jgi:hypothetical protein